MAHPDLVYPIPNNLGDVNGQAVNLLTGCMNLQVPLVSLAGLNVSYGVAALYNSRSANLSPVQNTLGGYGWKLLDYPKIVQDGARYFFLDGHAAWPIVFVTGNEYAANGPCYLWRIVREGPAWILTTEEARQYTLGNTSTSEGYTFWHLSEIKDLSWGDALTLTYDSGALTRIANTLGEALVFEGSPLTTIRYYRDGIEGKLGTNVRVQVLSYDDATGVTQLSSIVPYRVLPVGGTAAENAGYSFLYNKPTDEDYTYALAETLDPLGARVTYEYYLGQKIKSGPNLVSDQHPVICVRTEHFPQDSEDTDIICAGVWYDFSTWIYDTTALLMQFNTVKQYPGGVQATASYDTPGNPYGHTTSHFFNGIAADELAAFDQFDPDNPTDTTVQELRGQRYAELTQASVLTIDGGNLVDEPTPIGTVTTWITLAPQNNVLRLDYSVKSVTDEQSDVIFLLYDPNDVQVGRVEFVVANYETAIGTSVFPVSIQVAKIAMNSWWNPAGVNSISLIRAAATYSFEVPTQPTENLLHGQQIDEHGTFIEFPDPVWITGASYTMRAGTDEGSSVFYNLVDPSGKTVVSLNTSPWNYEYISGRQTFGAPILVSSISLYSWWNPANATSLVLDVVEGSTTGNLMHRQEMLDTPQTIVFDTPVERVVLAQYAITAGTSKVSNGHYDLISSTGETVATLTANPENGQTVWKVESFSIPVEVAAVRCYSWWNYAYAENLTLITTEEAAIPIPPSGLALTDDRLSERQAEVQNFVQVAILPSTSAAYAQLVKTTNTLDGVAETAEITWDRNLGLPVSTLTSQARPNETDHDSDFVVVRQQITYAFQQYPALTEIHLLAPIAQSVELRADVPGGDFQCTRAETTQWRQEHEGGPWSAWRRYVLNEVQSDFSGGFQPDPPAAWVLVENLRQRSDAGMPLLANDANGLMTSAIYDRDHGAYLIAAFSNADALAHQAAYVGFEEYEGNGGWTLQNGTVQSVYVHTGRAAYSGDAIGATGTPFVARAGVAYLVSAWVLLNENAECQLGFQHDHTWNGDPVTVPYDAANPGWVYAQAICSDPSGDVPVITVSSGAIDDISVYPVDAAFSATVYDWSSKNITARLSENGVVTRLYRDHVESAHFTTLMEQPRKLLWNASSRLNNRYFTGDTAHDSINPNGAIGLSAAAGGGVEDFHTVATPYFPRPNLSNFAIENNALVPTATPANATFAGSIDFNSFALAVEIEHDATGGELGFWLSSGETFIRCVLDLDPPKLKLYSLKDGVVAELPLHEAPRDMRLLLVVALSGVTLYANGRLALTHAFPDGTFLNSPLGVFTTVSECAFRNFAWASYPHIGTDTVDAMARPLQTSVDIGNAQVGVTAQLYGGALSLPGAVTRSTMQSGTVGFDSDFADFDADNMTVSGGIVNSWPQEYATQPFASSTIADRDPLLRQRSSGSGGSFTAGYPASEQFDYGDSPGTYFGFDKGELLYQTSLDPTGLLRQAFRNRQGVLFGETSIDRSGERSLLNGYEYDRAFRLVARHFPNAYAGGRLDPDHFKRTTTYDFAGRTTSVQTGDTGMSRLRYSRSGLQRLAQNARGAAAAAPYCVYTRYDRRGRVIEAGLWSGNIDDPTQADLDDPSWPAADITWQRRFAYDLTSDGQPNTIGRLVTASTPDAQENYSYDALGNLTGILTTAGDVEVLLTYTYDLLGRLISISGAGYDVVYTYDNAGRVTAVGTGDNPNFYAIYNYGNGSLSEDLNNGRIGRTYTTNAAGWTTVIADSYMQEFLYYETRFNGEPGYGNGQIASIQHQFLWSGAPLGYVYEYYYDGFGRLVTADNASYPQWSVGGGDSPLDYDANGNLLGMTLGPAVTPYIYSPNLNQIESVGGGTFTYDAAGAVLSAGKGPSFTYDPLTGQPASTTVAQGTNEYTYDARGRRLTLSGPGGTVTYIHGAKGGPLVEIAPDGTATAYVHGPLGLIAIVTSEPYFVLRGHRGSTRVIVDSGGQVVSYFSYLPHGGLIAPATSISPDLSVRYRFCGGEYESLDGLYSFGSRLYDPTLARFYSPDPLAQFPSPYAYASNPLTFRDPSGDWEIWDDVAAIVIGATVGGVAAAISGRNPVAGAVAGAVAGWSMLYMGAGLGVLTTDLVGDSIAGGIVNGAVSGMLEGAIQGTVQSTIENVAYGAHNDIALDAGRGAALGFLTGGALGGGSRAWLRYRRSSYEPDATLVAHEENDLFLDLENEGYRSYIGAPARTGRPAPTRSVADVRDLLNASSRRTLTLAGHGEFDSLSGQSAARVAGYLRGNNIVPERIMLRSCNNGTAGFAGELAQELQVPVYGSDEGIMAGSAYFEDGNYRLFMPSGWRSFGWRAIYRMLGYYPT